MPQIRELVGTFTSAELIARLEGTGLPFAPITKPQELLTDPHLLATGGLSPITLPDGDRAGQTVATVPLPFTLHGQRLPVRSPPRLGEHSQEVLGALGYETDEIERLSRLEPRA